MAKRGLATSLEPAFIVSTKRLALTLQAEAKKHGQRVRIRKVKEGWKVALVGQEN